ncbi:hypothetical protein KZX50_21235 [Bacillus infantis]|uniref:hypothetical protein n=1 Tax=Bacillus infantis TaxID=324767 RepID=UPI002003D2DE|nr:hypothetical protein [Bacillus infantis]MCK6207970.1 hypothetical protein [Bacillus infantis]
MLLSWIITAGFILCLGLVGGMFIHYLRAAMHTHDSVTVDLAPEETNEEIK